MDGEQIFAIIIMCFTSLGCAISFYVIGVVAAKRQKPMHFYSGTTIDPKTVSDIPAYNMACSKMWKLYSIPCWLSGILTILSIVYDPFMYYAVALLVGDCTIGIVWLIIKYQKIYKTYKHQ